MTVKTYRRSLDDGSSLNNLLLVHLGTGSVKVTDDGGHTGLVTHGGRQVDGLLGVILGEAVVISQYIVPNPKNFLDVANTNLLTFPR